MSRRILEEIDHLGAGTREAEAINDHAGAAGRIEPSNSIGLKPRVHQRLNAGARTESGAPLSLEWDPTPASVRLDVLLRA